MVHMDLSPDNILLDHVCLYCFDTQLRCHCLMCWFALCRHGLVHMDISPDNLLLDREFVSQEEVSEPVLCCLQPLLSGLLAAAERAAQGTHRQGNTRGTTTVAGASRVGSET
jgi:hypothetical protein